MKKISLIKDGIYPVSSLTPLLYTSTQAYHDLMQRTEPLLDNRVKKYQELEEAVCDTWTATGVSIAGAWVNQPLGDWEPENMVEFFKQTTAYAEQHGQNLGTELKRRVQLVLERDHCRAQAVALTQLYKTLLNHPEEMISMQESSFQYLRECESGEVLVEPSTRSLGDWRNLSKQMIQHANNAMNQKVQYRRLTRIDPEIEVIAGMSAPNSSDKNRPQKKKAKDDGSGPAL